MTWPQRNKNFIPNCLNACKQINMLVLCWFNTCLHSFRHYASLNICHTFFIRTVLMSSSINKCFMHFLHLGSQWIGRCLGQITLWISSSLSRRNFGCCLSCYHWFLYLPKIEAMMKSPSKDTRNFRKKTPLKTDTNIDLTTQDSI